jgi:hypothetical protein
MTPTRPRYTHLLEKQNITEVVSPTFTCGQATTFAMENSGEVDEAVAPLVLGVLDPPHIDGVPPPGSAIHARYD